MNAQGRLPATGASATGWRAFLYLLMIAIAVASAFPLVWMVLSSLKTPAEAMRYAVASGAKAVLKKGPMEGTATFAELDAFLKDAAR